MKYLGLNLMLMLRFILYMWL